MLQTLETAKAAHMVGRKRKQGKRHKCGKFIIEKALSDPKTVAITRRIIDQARQGALDSRLGFEVGRLRLLNRIDDKQFDAACKLASLSMRYDQVTKAPMRHPKAANLDGIGGASLFEDNPEADKAIQDAYQDAIAAIGQKHLIRAADHVIINDQPCVSHDMYCHLKDALNRLNHFWESKRR